MFGFGFPVFFPFNEVLIVRRFEHVDQGVFGRLPCDFGRCSGGSLSGGDGGCFSSSGGSGFCGRFGGGRGGSGSGLFGLGDDFVVASLSVHGLLKDEGSGGAHGSVNDGSALVDVLDAQTDQAANSTGGNDPARVVSLEVIRVGVGERTGFDDGDALQRVNERVGKHFDDGPHGVENHQPRHGVQPGAVAQDKRSNAGGFWSCWCGGSCW